MRLLEHYLEVELEEVIANGIRRRVIGRLDRVPPSLRKRVEEAICAPANGRHDALSSRSPTEGAPRSWMRRVGCCATPSSGRSIRSALDEKTFAAYLYDPELPDPDLLIRTGAESRVSNFLLWQIAYSEIYTTEVMWPDFREAHLEAAFLDYQFARAPFRAHERPGGRRSRRRLIGAGRSECAEPGVATPSVRERVMAQRAASPCWGARAASASRRWPSRSAFPGPLPRGGAGGGPQRREAGRAGAAAPAELVSVADAEGAGAARGLARRRLLSRGSRWGEAGLEAVAVHDADLVWPPGGRGGARPTLAAIRAGPRRRAGQQGIDGDGGRARAARGAQRTG
jgi:hypothetical protein